MRTTRHHAARGSRGALLMETSIALMIFTVVAVAVLVGLSTAQRSGAKTSGQAEAENLARNQMESVFASPYLDPPATYAAVAAPAGYAVTAQAQQYVLGDTNIQTVAVTVSQGSQQLLVLEALRTK